VNSWKRGGHALTIPVFGGIAMNMGVIL
jgi:hypothetical protein